ncbi:MAG: DeoR/GlpR family DNA-binding transcription regulator [Verrucomicrobia bacterium]|nr:DeoR/GlpR family DNA-binding transcription regulator [Verrucomicrobiota bacterium]MCF7707323.1 DeoR/GlpR family DNA-binding transcription regulator [Verrucomicrobiota bacterium]
MQPEARRKFIETYLQKTEFASLEELAEHVNASQSTVRRDLTALEAAGTVRRTHGGARIINPRTDEFIFTSRDTRQMSEKSAIGRVCAGLLEPGHTIIMDAGTTVYHVAKHLEDTRFQIITNSLPVANLFASAALTEIIVSGGVVYPRLGVLVGPLAVEAFGKMHADIAIMGAGGITSDGITNSHGLLIGIQRAMIRAASKVVFCMDSSKFNRKSVSFLCNLDQVDMVITDSKAPAGLVRELRSKGIEVIVAEIDNPLSSAR